MARPSRCASPGSRLEVHFSDPEAIREILLADAEDLRAGEANVILEPCSGHSCCSSMGPAIYASAA
jgi:hypothetical protein